MITAKEKAFIVSVWGAKYGKPLVAKLKGAKVFNTKGKPFSVAGLSMIVSSHRENSAVEFEILKITKAEANRQQALLQKRKQLSQK